MEDEYKRMYAILCVAIDNAITALSGVPGTEIVSFELQKALYEAENVYIGAGEVIITDIGKDNPSL